MKTLLLAGTVLFGGIFGANQGLDMARGHRANPQIIEEHAPLREYAASILEGIDLEVLTPEEVEGLKAELRVLLAEKAAELGIELPAGFDFFQSNQHGVLMQELMTYFRALRAELDWETLSPEERVAAVAEIKTLVQERAVELGIDRPIMGGAGAQHGARGPQQHRRGPQRQNPRTNATNTTSVPTTTNTL